VLNLYGIFISLGIFLSLISAQKIIEKKNEEILWGISFWAILFGIIGARIYHVIDLFGYYSTHLLDIFKIWRGGLGIWGALIGGIIGTYFYLKFKHEKILPWLDVVSVVVPLGQAIGRWGNFFNNELFGYPTTLPWGIYVSPNNRPEQFLIFDKFHPLFIYESVLNLILFLTLFKIYKKFSKNLPSGVFLALYLGGYSVIRFFLEFMRISPWEINLENGIALNVSQCISILVLAFSLVFFKLRTKK